MPQMGAAAARMAMLRAGIKAEDIGLLIAGTSSPDNVYPGGSGGDRRRIGHGSALL